VNETITFPQRRTLVVLILLLLALAVAVGMLDLRLGRGGPLPTPRITSAPLQLTLDPHAVIAFEGGRSFECALDTTQFSGCSSPVDYGVVSRGPHTFLVRATGHVGRVSDTASWHWTVVDNAAGSGTGSHLLGNKVVATGGESFTVAGGLVPLLSPGTGGPLRLKVRNPHAYPIDVTSLAVSVASGSSHPGCDGRVELAVTQSSVTAGGTVLRVPAHAAVTLPAAGVTAPFLRMRNRPVNQDACKHARFTLRYSGIARRTRGG
jgi:hypothetical protein